MAKHFSFGFTAYRIHLDSRWLTVISALYFTTVLNLSLWRYILRHLTVADTATFFFGISIPIVIFTALYLLFNLLLIPYLAKPVLILLLFIASATNYFMFEYGIFIDSGMIRNVFETNTREALDLMTLRFILWVIVGGVLPAICLTVTRIDYQSFRTECKSRLFAITGCLITTGMIAAFFFKEYASFGRNHQDTHRLINPISTIYATGRYLHIRSLVDKQLRRLDASAKLMPYEGSVPAVFILVVGETARAANFSLNGYPRDTNPLLSKENVIAFQDVYSCGTATATSIPCMFSNMTREHFHADNARYTENLMDLLQQTGFNVLWLENDDGCKEVCNRVPTRKVYKSNDPRYCDGQSCFDEILLDNLEEYIANVKKDTFIVLHTIGSHGPTYYKRYPETFRKFRPTCDTSDLQNCTREEIINTYDNTILYTDYVVSSAIGILKKFPHLESGLLYISDHGESLGENNIYLHGLPYSIAPEEQKKVPMVLWMSDTMQKLDHLNYGCIARQATDKTWSHDNLFHTLLALMGISSRTYDKTLDIFDDCRTKPLPWNTAARPVTISATD